MRFADNHAEDDAYAINDLFAVDVASEARAIFLRRTYGHLLGAIVAFICLTGIFLKTPAIREPLFSIMQAGHWYFILIGFMVVGWVAQRWANNGASLATQYAGLALYTVAEAIFFVPLLYFAILSSSETVIPTAGILTLIVFGGLTAVVFATGADFSFLRSVIVALSLTLLGAMVMTWVFGMGFSPVLFASIGVALGSVAILYDTSNVLHHYRTDQYVAASLQLFASVALLFWYVLQLVMFNDD